MMSHLSLTSLEEQARLFSRDMRRWVSTFFTSAYPPSYMHRMISDLSFIHTLRTLCSTSEDYIDWCINWATRSAFLSQDDFPLEFIVTATVFVDIDNEKVDEFFDIISNILSSFRDESRVLTKKDFIRYRLQRYLSYLSLIRC